MRNQVQRQLIYRVFWKDNEISANIAPLSVSRQLSVWQFTHEASRRGASLQGQSGVMLTLRSLIGRNTHAIRGLVHRNMGRGLIGWLIKVSRAVLFHCKPSTVRQIGHFVSRLRTLYRTQGGKGTTLYLKSCQVLLQQSIAGYKVRDITELKTRVKRNKAGLPRIIPSGARASIRKGDINSIRLWMTLLGWYRISDFRGKLSLATITDPGKVIAQCRLDEWELFLRDIFIPTLSLKYIPAKHKVRLNKIQPFPIRKSGPTTATDRAMIRSVGNSSFYALVFAAKTWMNHPLYETLKRFLTRWAMWEGQKFSVILQRMVWASDCRWEDSRWGQKIRIPRFLAKLGFKEEAAGKVRVFAMVDAWTQWVMRPIHDMIFDILKFIPMDGTFDQVRPVERLRSLPRKGRWFYSIDLSAATDRLPIRVQIPLMKYLLSLAGVPEPDKWAQDWADLLVKREYQVKVPKDSNFDLPDDLPEFVTYSVGQPMGALSSWAMLAITHHAIVHWAARRAYNKGAPIRMPFQDYAILGDDIVILNRAVAIEYLCILDWLGVKAGLAKSIVSRDFYLEFAKKFFVPSGRADMLPLKEAISVYSSTILTCEFIRKYNLSLGQILSFLGYGYKSKSRALQAHYWQLPKRLKVLMIWFRSPVGAFPLDALSWLKSSGFTSQWDVPDNWVGWKFVVGRLFRIGCKLLTRYSEALERYKQSIEVTGQIYDMDHYLRHRMLKESPKSLRKVRIPLAKSGKLVRPLSQHPPYLREALVRNDRKNSFHTEPVPFSTLVASTDFDPFEASAYDITNAGIFGWVYNLLIPKSWQKWMAREISTFNRDYGVVDLVHKPVVTLPECITSEELNRTLFYANLPIHPPIKRVKLLLEWLFNFDKIASQVPSEHWPQYRVLDKTIKEFLTVTEWWEEATKPFFKHRLNPRLKLDNKLSGNTPIVALVPVKQGAQTSPVLDKLSHPDWGVWKWVGNECKFDWDSTQEGAMYSTALKEFRLILPLPPRPIPDFRSYRPVKSDWKTLINWMERLQAIILLSTIIWLVPLYDNTVEQPIEVPPVDVFNWYPLIGIIIILLPILYLNLFPSGSTVEASVFDTISQQAQRISELEVRMIRQRCEVVDLNEIIEGLETALEESHQEIEVLTQLLSEFNPWR